jgi:hypothetical protein
VTSPESYDSGGLIRFYRTTRYRSSDELLSDVNFKLVRAVEKFDPAQGFALTFMSKVIANVLFTSVANARKDLQWNRKLSKNVLNSLVTNGEIEGRHAVEDLAHRIRRGVRTTLEDAKEQDVQRWFVASFCDEGFAQCRYEWADAAIAVFGLTHDRSRELYDLTMLEVRRVLYDDLPSRQSIPAGRLLGTRFAWMARYQSLLTAEEFTKLVVLMRGLSPFCVCSSILQAVPGDKIGTRQSGGRIYCGSSTAIPARCRSLSDRDREVRNPDRDRVLRVRYYRVRSTISISRNSVHRRIIKFLARPDLVWHGLVWRGEVRHGKAWRASIVNGWRSFFHPDAQPLFA